MLRDKVAVVTGGTRGIGFETVRTFLENNAKVIFDDPVKSPTPGQSLVLYNDTKLIGGGIIKYTEK